MPEFVFSPLVTVPRIDLANARYKTGVYFTPLSVANTELLDDTLDRLQKAGADTLVFDVKGSSVYFQSEAPMANELKLVNPAYDLDAIVDKIHDRGMYAVGRFIAIKDGSLAKAKPEAQIRHPLTGKSVGAEWVDPWHPDVIRYNTEILRDLVRSGIDEVNFDYIRYPTEYYPDFETIGLTGAQKADHLVTFLEAARKVVDEEGTGTKLGVSTYAIIGWDFTKNVESVGQDIARYAPLVDIISPMAYPATFAMNAYYNPGQDPGSRMYYLVWRTLEGYKQLLKPEDHHKLRPWIQGYGITNKNLRDQIQGVLDAGMCGFTVWNADNAYAPVYDVLNNWEVPVSCGGTGTERLLNI